MKLRNEAERSGVGMKKHGFYPAAVTAQPDNDFEPADSTN